jgi:membrane-associated protease RseP (regulator of RpoE activity)
VLVVYLRDGSGYGVTDYWVADGMLLFVTTYDSEKSVAFEDVDWQRTVDENATRGVYFKLSYSPSKQRRTPAIAPTCPAYSRENAGAGSSRRPVSDEIGPFGAAVAATDQGLRVTFVRAGSPAAQVGINPGDVVLRIDCQQVHSSADIESAIAANISGAPWVSYLIKGAWLSGQQIQPR